MGERALSFRTCTSTVGILASGSHLDPLLMRYIGEPNEACGLKGLMAKHQRSIRSDMQAHPQQHVPSRTNYNLISYEGLREIKTGLPGHIFSYSMPPS